MFLKYLKYAAFMTGSLVLVTTLVFGLDKQSVGPCDAKPAEVKLPTPAQDIPSYLQEISVTIHAEDSQGSGVIKTRDGVNYVLTAGHVVEGLRKTRNIIDKTGSQKVLVEFSDAKVVKEIYDDDHRSVGRLLLDAEVLRYSDSENGEDLALLRIRKKNFVKCSVRFDSEKKVPVGTDLLHVGSLLGQQGSNSLTTGVVSQHGRVRKGVVYDQSTCAAFPGSSGGGIYRKSSGEYIGMLVRGAGEIFNLYVPMRRIQKWADRVGVKFVLDNSVPVPDEKTLHKCPIEETVTNTCDAMPAAKRSQIIKNFPFLIQNNSEFNHLIYND